MEYFVVIPTYKRPQILKEKTLKMLLEGKVKPEQIFVFVANKQEAVSYKSFLDPKSYNSIIVGKKGITNQRKFIARYFPENTNILSVDDDVVDLYKLDGDKAFPFKDVDRLVKEAFKELHKKDLYIWGVHPTYNAFYMQDKVTTDLKFIIGTFYGFRVRHSRDLIPTVGEKEDYELSILHYIKDGGVLRYNNIGIKTRFHNPEGGLGGIENRFSVNKKAAEYLAKKYPQYARIKIRPKNGMYEIMLRRQPKNV